MCRIDFQDWERRGIGNVGVVRVNAIPEMNLRSEKLLRG